MIILALDSGIERCGYSIYDASSNPGTLISYGLLSTPKSDTLEKRMFDLRSQFEKIVSTYKPNKVIMESLFFNVNKKTFLTIAQSQGALLASCGAQLIPVEFLTPLSIKQIVTGDGKADKKQVEKMVMLLLQLETAPKPDDVVDAIACGYAYCCLNTYANI